LTRNFLWHYCSEQQKSNIVFLASWYHCVEIKCLFKLGQSGNPAGRSSGRRSYTPGDQLYIRAMCNERDPVEFLENVMASPTGPKVHRAYYQQADRSPRGDQCGAGER
jgi:hypothetical protein